MNYSGVKIVIHKFMGKLDPTFARMTVVRRMSSVVVVLFKTASNYNGVRFMNLTL